MGAALKHLQGNLVALRTLSLFWGREGKWRKGCFRIPRLDPKQSVPVGARGHGAGVDKPTA